MYQVHFLDVLIRVYVSVCQCVCVQCYMVNFIADAAHYHTHTHLQKRLPNLLFYALGEALCVIVLRLN